MKLCRKSCGLTPETPQEAAILLWLARYFDNTPVFMSVDTIHDADWRNDRMEMTLQFNAIEPDIETDVAQERPRCLGTNVSENPF